MSTWDELSTPPQIDQLRGLALQRNWGLSLLLIGWLHLLAFSLCYYLTVALAYHDALGYLAIWVGEFCGAGLIFRLCGGRPSTDKTLPLARFVVRVWAAYFVLAFNLGTMNTLRGHALFEFFPAIASLASFAFLVMGFTISRRFFPAVLVMFAAGLLMATFLLHAYLIFALAWWLVLNRIGLVLLSASRSFGQRKSDLRLREHSMKAVGGASVASLFLLAVILGEAAQAPKQAGIATSEFLFTEVPFAQCHASTIVETPSGTLLAAWFGGTREGHRDVGIWLTRRVGGQWTKPVEVVNGVQSTTERYPCWNPVLFQPKNGPLMLFYKVGPSPTRWWGKLTTSADDGQTWSAARRLPAEILGPIKNKPLQLANGDLLCPSSTEHDGWRVHFERTADLGQTWTKTEPLNDGKTIAAIQPSLLVHGDGRLQALGRSRQGRLWQAWSQDQGKTWSALELTALPNPNSGTDAVTLADGRFLLVYNHTMRGRSPLNVALSEDGQRWKAALVLEREPGEYSYPAVIQTRDGLVHVTYTWKRQRIKHVVLDPKQLVLKEGNF